MCCGGCGIPIGPSAKEGGHFLGANDQGAGLGVHGQKIALHGAGGRARSHFQGPLFLFFELVRKNK